MNSIEGRIERLEKSRPDGESIKVIIIQEQGDTRPTQKQVDEKLNKYMEEHPNYQGIVTLDFRIKRQEVK